MLHGLPSGTPTRSLVVGLFFIVEGGAHEGDIQRGDGVGGEFVEELVGDIGDFPCSVVEEP